MIALTHYNTHKPLAKMSCTNLFTDITSQSNSAFYALALIKEGTT